MKIIMQHALLLKFRICIVVLAVITIAGTASKRAQASEMTIAAVVNESAISHSDVEDRLKLVRESARLPDNKEIRERLIPQIIDTLIEEQIKMQEAERLGIDIAEAEIEQGFTQLANQNNIDPNKFKSLLESRNINLQTMRNQIAAQVAWGKVVQARLRPQIVISQPDIDVVLERFQRGIGMEEYLVSEIVLPFDEGASQSEIKKLADRLVAQIRDQKVPFFRVAQQFSKSAGAAQGGDLGWVPEDQLSEDLAEAVGRLNKGQVSQPIKTTSGYHIVFLRDKRTLTEDNIPSTEEITNTIGQQRLNRLQAQYLLDLKGVAFIENRV